MLVRLDLHPGRRQLRQFGGVALFALGGVGLVSYFSGELFGIRLGGSAAPVAYGLWALGAVSGAFALVWPEGNRPLFVALSVVAFPIGWVFSHAVLVVIFYLIVTPVGLLFRLMGRDSLARRFDPERESYWVDLPEPSDKSYYFRQF